MARYTDSACRLCRREGFKIFLKGDRCYSDKCAFERRGYIPGDHGQMRRKQQSDYGVQLREKQKLKRMYGLLEKQFHGSFETADRQKGITGANLLLILERRLDNMVFRMGFANSRNEARQLVTHRHFLVNGRTVNIPSYLLKIGDEVTVKERSRKIVRIHEALEMVARRGVPQWIDLNKEGVKAVVKTLPTREELIMPIQEQLVVELYSK
ncbi:MAG: 30S ribosomal protein S4 [Syntrophobacteraceae bacterium CG23_combo_of_CG06-09_8_20_14_all_50_8]|nr:MAG: 30S ribosomal protein S4 [Syntrophobacteraceae bacterium CG23_combo_of_CG06-09_8_20_14_all_50_8]